MLEFLCVLGNIFLILSAEAPEIIKPGSSEAEPAVTQAGTEGLVLVMRRHTHWIFLLHLFCRI